MISKSLQVFSRIIVIAYLLILARFLKKGTLLLKYTLLWLVAGIVVGIFCLFPEMLVFVSRIMGIETASNGLFAICIMFVIFILLSLTSIVSYQKKRLRQLSQQIAMLENRIREIELKGGQVQVEDDE
jgi:hypothetical protein